jgi:hypothetical protein
LVVHAGSVPSKRIRSETAMRLYIDTSKAASGFMVSRGFEPKVDITTGRIKTDRATGQELQTIQLTAFDERGGEVITVTVAGAVREIPVMTPVSVVDLEAIPWNNNGRSGVAFRAASVTPVNAGRTTTNNATNTSTATSTTAA